MNIDKIKERLQPFFDNVEIEFDTGRTIRVYCTKGDKRILVDYLKVKFADMFDKTQTNETLDSFCKDLRDVAISRL